MSQVFAVTASEAVAWRTLGGRSRSADARSCCNGHLHNFPFRRRFEVFSFFPVEGNAVHLEHRCPSLTRARGGAILIVSSTIPRNPLNLFRCSSPFRVLPRALTPRFTSSRSLSPLWGTPGRRWGIDWERSQDKHHGRSREDGRWILTFASNDGHLQASSRGPARVSSHKTFGESARRKGTSAAASSKVADPGSSRPTAILPRLIHSYPTRILLQLLPISLLQPTRPPRDPSPFPPFPHATSASCAAGSRPTDGIPPL